MIQFYEATISESSVYEEITRNLKKLCSLLDYHIVGIINFSCHKNFLYSRNLLIKQKNRYKNLNKSVIKRISKLENPIVNLLIQKKEILLYSKDNSSYETLVPEAKSEMYIPLFNEYNDDIIGSIYLSKIIVSDKASDLNKLHNSNTMNIIKAINTAYRTAHLLLEKRHSIFSIINTFSEMTREKDPFMLLHPYHVANFAKELAIKLGLSETLVKKTYLSGILHDVGKIYMPEHLLTKKAHLTDNEYEIIKKHSIYSYNLIKNITGLDDIARFVKYHHENYDGTGYPCKLRGDQIPLISRIIKVADSVDAMLSPRAYKKPKNINYVISELIRCKGLNFDPRMTDGMLEILANHLKPMANVPLNSITWANLTLSTVKRMYSLEGILIRYNSGYLFKTDKFNFSYDIDVSEIQNSSIYISRSTNEFIEYKAIVSYVTENEVFISDCEYVVYEDSFNILWELKGQLKLSNFKMYDVQICKIGGNMLTFYLPQNTLHYYNSNNGAETFKIFFDDGTVIDIAGRLSKNFTSGGISYYDFVYSDLLPKTKDEIFKQLFRHQVQIKNLYNN
ncbi:HD-GYP domain-containing protein [Clostridium sp. CT7]|uniref:HD-GYP domain-containing protein n=1 Tax=Clostridium sp. CT7 TaxID=2052574 RepID=UPI0008241C2C|nr:MULTISPECIES: HD-GYP domain-containing protein [Clostridium]PJI07494.1 HD-GYP domain-containing protein [Clostridium sp. CT7]